MNIKVFLYILGYLFLCYIGLHLGHSFQVSIDMGSTSTDIFSTAIDKFIYNSENNILAPVNTLFLRNSLTPLFLLFANVIALAIGVTMYDQRRKYRRGEEHGSAVFSEPKDFLSVQNKKDKFNNIILTQEVYLNLKHFVSHKNLNVVVVGGPGSGKTRFFVKPNLCQLSSSFIVTDPKGEVLASTGKMLKKAGYRIKVLNLVSMGQSDFYNPFVYLRKDNPEDVLTLLTTIVKNTSGDNKQKSGDPFWENAELLFLQAIFFYILYEEDLERQNMSTVMEMLRMANFSDEKNPLDDLYERLEKREPHHIAVTQYKLCKASAIETLRSVVIMANARFVPFAIETVSNLFSKDNFQLSELDNQRTAIFVIISPSNTTFNFIGAMFYTQYFAQVDYIANWVNPSKGLPKRLQIPILMVLDEFANIGKIPNFEKILAYARSLNVGIFTIIQSLVQLKDMYGEGWEQIIDASDTMLFLGGQSKFTLEYMSQKIGKQTIDNKNKSKSFGKQRSTSQNEAILGRELMTPDEIAIMPKNKALLFINGFRTLKGTKFDVVRHKNYKLLSEEENFYVHKVKNKQSKIIYTIKIPADMLFSDEEDTRTADMAKLKSIILPDKIIENKPEDINVRKTINNYRKQNLQNLRESSTQENVIVNDTKAAQQVINSQDEEHLIIENKDKALKEVLEEKTIGQKTEQNIINSDIESQGEESPWGDVFN